MVTITETICDVWDCKEEAYHSVDCCCGWKISTSQYGEKTKYKKFEKPIKETKKDLCEEHWKQWSKVTCKILKMDKEKKDALQDGGENAN